MILEKRIDCVVFCVHRLPTEAALSVLRRMRQFRLTVHENKCNKITIMQTVAARPQPHQDLWSTVQYLVRRRMMTASKGAILLAGVSIRAGGHALKRRTRLPLASGTSQAFDSPSHFCANFFRPLISLRR